MTHCLARVIGFWSQVFIGLLLFGLGTPPMTGAPAAPAAAGSTGVRFGTFHRGSLVMAFYRSAIWSDKLDVLKEQRKKAAVDGDFATVDKIEGQIRSMQETAEKQFAGKEPIDNILGQLKPMWAEIAREANVQVIIEEPLFIVPNTPLVDLTPYLLSRFPPKPRAPSS